MSKFIRMTAALAGLLFEIFFVLLLLQGRPRLFPLFLVVHAVACIVFVYGLVIFFPATGSWGRISLFCCGLLGIYGFAGTGLMLLLSRLRKDRGEVFHLDLEEEDETGETAADDWQGLAGGAAEILEVECLGDILKGDDKELRLGAISALQKLNDKNAISMLSDSLDSTFQDVRYYAVEALNKIAQAYLDKISVLQQMVAIKPDDNVIRLTLADLYFEYAFKGIEEAAIRGYYYGLAAAEYRQLLAVQPAEPRLLENLLEAEYRLAHYPDCIMLCRQLLQQEVFHQQACRRLADCYLKTRQYARLRELAAELAVQEKWPVEWRQAAEMWI